MKMWRVYCGMQLVNSFEVRAHAEAYAKDRERETGFRVGGTYNRICWA